MYDEYIKEKNHVGRVTRSRRFNMSSPNLTSTPNTTFTSTIQEQTRSDNLDENILAFLVSSALPLSTIESDSFQKLLSGVVPTQRHLMNMIDNLDCKMKSNLKQIVSEVSSFCATINIWTFRKKLIFGYTLHWICNDYSRKSVALGFRSFRKNRASQNIPDYLKDLNSEYGITRDKIITTITNNDDCSIKAFNEFGLHDCYQVGEVESSDLQEDDKAQTLKDLSNFCQPFPNHTECVIQSLLTFATSDFIDLLKPSSVLHEFHLKAFQKCADIWNKCSTYDNSDRVKDFFSFTLKLPSSIDWITLYDSIRCLLSFREKLNELCNFLEIPTFDSAEIEYLEEYCQLNAPIVDAIKFLQTESQMFFGYFLPTLVTIKVKFHKLNFESLKFLRILGREWEKQFFERFKNFFELRPECIVAAVAAVSCPIIKLKFVKALSQIVPKVSTEQVRLYFLNYAREFQVDVVVDSLDPQNSEDHDTTMDHEFFDFGNCSSGNVKQDVDPLSHIRREFDRYIADEDSSLMSLDEYPIVKKVFMKYNTPLPSYASVRRLFAYSDLTSPERYLKRSDRQFEKFVLMKANGIWPSE